MEQKKNQMKMYDEVFLTANNSLFKMANIRFVFHLSDESRTAIMTNDLYMFRYSNISFQTRLCFESQY